MSDLDLAEMIRPPRRKSRREFQIFALTMAVVYAVVLWLWLR